MALKIRHPDEHDKGALLFMAKAMHIESPRFRGRDFNLDKMNGVVDFLLGDINSGIFVVEEDGVVTGMIAGIVCEHFFGKDKYVSDLAVYVQPEKRGGSAALRLIRAFEEWSFKHGACEVLLGVSTGIEMERTVALYQRLGYTLTACALIKTKEQFNV